MSIKDAIAESLPSSTHALESGQVPSRPCGKKLAIRSSHRWTAQSTFRKRASYWLRAEGLVAKAGELQAERQAAEAVKSHAKRQAAKAIVLKQKDERRAALVVERRADRQAVEAVKR